MIMANAAAWQAALDGASDARTRPEPGKWSPLEYACHVRDVFRLYDQRLELMLSQDDPQFPNWDQDETAVADRYGEQDPAEVAAALRRAAFAIAGRFEGVTGDQWRRTGTPQRRRPLHRGDLRPLLRARPGAPPLRRHRPARRTEPDVSARYLAPALRRASARGPGARGPDRR